ncbi:MAG: hypothetical protein ABIQ64_00205 [Candidatus Saccharimonadales bacterium]
MKLSRNQIITVTIITFLLIGLTFWFMWQRSSSDLPGSSLQPKKTLLVAGTRVVSPCAALPESDVQNIFGTFGPKSYIDEKYYARSANETEVKELGSSFPNTVSCNYFLDDAANTTVRVKFEQFASNELAARDWKESASYDKARASEYLKQFEAGIPNAAQYKLDPEKLQAAADAFKSAIESTGNELDTQEISNTNGSILFAPNRGGFITLSGNRILTLNYEFGSSNFLSKDRQIDQSEVLIVSDKVKSTFDVILANIKNEKLSQGPSPTLRNNDALKTVGTTKILDSCEVLTDENVKSSLSVGSLSTLVERTSVIKDPKQLAQNTTTLPRHTCLKRMVKTDNITGYVSLELGFGTNKEQALSYFTSSIKPTEPNLPSEAEQSKIVEFTRGTILVQFVRFQHGPYAGTLTITKDGRDKPIPIDKSVYTTALNNIIMKLSR